MDFSKLNWDLPATWRWAAAAVGVAFFVSLMFSDFFEFWGKSGFATAVAISSVHGPQTGYSLGFPSYAFDIPIRIVMAVSAVAAFGCLMVAAQKQRAAGLPKSEDSEP